MEKIEIKMLNYETKNEILMKQILKIREELRELELALFKHDKNNFIEECFDVIQATVTLLLLYFKKNNIKKYELSEYNLKHIKKLEERSKDK